LLIVLILISTDTVCEWPYSSGLHQNYSSTPHEVDASAGLTSYERPLIGLQ